LKVHNRTHSALQVDRGSCGRNRMVVGSTTTYAIIVYHH